MKRAQPFHPSPGSIALVGAGPGALDLLTLRARDRIAAADVIFYDRLVDPTLLCLARSNAETVFVGKEVGAHSWPQDRINAVIVAAALRGQRVVRLKSGDPSIFGRACEELEAARSLGIAVEIVPGVTAASAAAASLARPLTERGETDRLVIATGTCKPGDADPDWAAMLTPGTTLVLYMAMQRLDAVASNLRGAGFAADIAVEIVSSASHASEMTLRCSLADMATRARAEGIGSPAVLLLRHPKPARSRSAARLQATAHA
jgi:uroporphyrin-III C-methyltransferase/precorrin-2 dehydrogenase/sirohydrochlorin ferrochelatase